MLRKVDYKIKIVSLIWFYIKAEFQSLTKFFKCEIQRIFYTILKESGHKWKSIKHKWGLKKWRGIRKENMIFEIESSVNDLH